MPLVPDYNLPGPRHEKPQTNYDMAPPSFKPPKCNTRRTDRSNTSPVCHLERGHKDDHRGYMNDKWGHPVYWKQNNDGGRLTPNAAHPSSRPVSSAV